MSRAHSRGPRLRTIIAGVMRPRLLFAPLLILLALSACKDNDDPAVPIEDVPGDKLLVDLTADEFTGLCDWSAEIADEKLTPETACEGTRVQFHGCMRVNERCMATVDEWRTCLPDMMDAFAADPCAALQVRSAETFAAFLEQVPSCEGLSRCANTTE